MIQPGLYCTPEGLEVIAQDADGRIVRIHLPLDLDGLEDAARKILGAVSAMRAAQREAAVAGEKPRVTKLNGGNARWN